MKLLFVFAHTGLTRHFHRVMELAAQSGHKVHVVIGREKGRIQFETMEALSKYPNIVSEQCQTLTGFADRILRNTRGILSYLVYREPRHPSPKLARRFVKVFGSRIWTLINLPGVTSLLRCKPVRGFLRFLEKLLPANKHVLKQLLDLKPDLVFGAPFIFNESTDIEYLKAARALNIPTCAAIVSWDNLSTKGTVQIPVDRLMVWNEALKGEAAELHGINPECIDITGAPSFDYLFKLVFDLDSRAFAKRIRAPSGSPIVLYLCSSGTIVKNETGLVARMAEALAMNPATANCTLLVRPHPLHHKLWHNFNAPHKNIIVWPRNGELPDNPDSLRNFVNSIGNSVAVLGANTSAFLEAAIQDRPCIMLPDLDGYLEKDIFGHFMHLLRGGWMYAPLTYEDAALQVGSLLAGVDVRADCRRRFIKDFLRPHGMDTEGSRVMLDILLDAALNPRKRSESLFFRRQRHISRTNRNVLIAIPSVERLPSCESLLYELNALGYRVEVVFTKHPKLNNANGIQAHAESQSEYSILHEYYTELSRRAPLTEFCVFRDDNNKKLRRSRLLRILRSYKSYLHRFPSSNFYRQRWESFIPLSLKPIATNPLFHLVLRLPGLSWLLRILDSRIASPSILDYLRLHQPAFILATPTNTQNSAEAEWIKAGLHIGIPTGILVFSWDNLTTKGLIPYSPDILFAWNRDHVDEAVGIHEVPRNRCHITGALVFDRWHDAQRLVSPHEEACRLYGLDPAKPYILYMGSSSNIAKDETWIVLELTKALQQADDPALHGIQILVRPHPSNPGFVEHLREVPGVYFLPAWAGFPFTEMRQREMASSIAHSLLTVGINTSAIIEAIILGKPCLSIRTDRYSDTHTESAHFGHLLEHGVVEMADSVSDCVRLIGDHLKGTDTSRLQREAFVRGFVWPHGLDRTAASIACRAIHKLATKQPAVTPSAMSPQSTIIESDDGQKLSDTSDLTANSLLDFLTANSIKLSAQFRKGIRELFRQSLFNRMRHRSRIRELTAAEIFPEAPEISVPLAVINDHTGHRNHAEMLYVAAVASACKPRKIFEFGTSVGRTSLALARLCREAQVYTLDLPDDGSVYLHNHVGILFRDAPESKRIIQLRCDSSALDTTQYQKQMDFIWIDGNHDYDFVKNDTAKAFEMLTPGGVIMWHDYAPKKLDELVRFFVEFTQATPLFWIKSTSLLLHIDGVDPLTFVPHKHALLADVPIKYAAR